MSPNPKKIDPRFSPPRGGTKGPRSSRQVPPTGRSPGSSRSSGRGKRITAKDLAPYDLGTLRELEEKSVNRFEALQTIYQLAGRPRKRILFVFTIILLAVFVLFVLMLRRSSEIIETNFQNAGLTEDLHDAEKSLAIEEDRLLATLDLNKIKKEAIEIYGMRLPSEAQRMMIRFPKSDRTLVLTNPDMAQEQTGGKSQNLINYPSILNYFKGFARPLPQTLDPGNLGAPYPKEEPKLAEASSAAASEAAQSEASAPETETSEAIAQNEATELEAPLEAESSEATEVAPGVETREETSEATETTDETEGDEDAGQ